MAFPGQILQHPFTGEKVEFLETSSSTKGERLRMKVTTPANIGPPFLHYHLYQRETFYIEKGQIEIVIGKQKRVLSGNQTIEIPVGVSHTYKNIGEHPAVKIVEMQPAGTFELFVENLIGLAQDGKTNKKGVASPLQMILTQYQSGIYIAYIPKLFQNILWKLAKWMAKPKGIQAYYAKYSS